VIFYLPKKITEEKSQMKGKNLNFGTIIRKNHFENQYFEGKLS